MTTPDATAYYKDIGIFPRGVHRLGRLYATGFGLSLLCTFGAYGFAVSGYLAPHALVIALLVFALAQFVVQVVCFLHLGHADDAHDRRLVLGFALLVTAIIVVGSLWIMANLNRRMRYDPTQFMTQEMEQYMSSQPGL